jgi:tRNA (guanine37-N1)-methyltransferase
MMAGYDIVGDIAVLQTEGLKKKEISKHVKVLLKKPNINTVVGKSDRLKGRLRTLKPKHLGGEKKFDTVQVESGCKFYVDISKCYFSPRLSGERLEIAKKIKKKDKVLCLFSGVAPFPVVIAKKTNCERIVSVELGRECVKMAMKNVVVNNVKNKIDLIQGDVKRVALILKKKKERFDVIVMARPNLKESFLKEGLMLSKKGTRIYYYCFCKNDELDSVTGSLVEEARKHGKRIKVIGSSRAGEIAPYKFRYRLDIRVL